MSEETPLSKDELSLIWTTAVETFPHAKDPDGVVNFPSHLDSVKSAFTSLFYQPS